MATSDGTGRGTGGGGANGGGARRPVNGLLRRLESRKNLTGSACALAGVALALAGATGPWWPAVVAALYAAGALLAPPERPDPPRFASPGELLAALRTDLAVLRGYLAGLELPAPATTRLGELDGLLEGLTGAEETARDARVLHALGSAIRQDIPEAVDGYLRTRWWSRLAPGTESPEEQLRRQLDSLHAELTGLAGSVRESLELRQQSHTHYLELRRPEPGGDEPGRDEPGGDKTGRDGSGGDGSGGDGPGRGGAPEDPRRGRR
ncbi:hypothetical protein [Streptomyces sp. YIM 98790]|uniref:hypothetical protein n=1 Tax=Streptomyces sp. YIM 98790 TaxID=2689077 RepID=UPI0028BD852C|nr:hypothetical protein [Streptomyces sp. YIM 98790]